MSADTVTMRLTSLKDSDDQNVELGDEFEAVVVPRSAYERVWKHRGWTAVDDEDEEPTRTRTARQQPKTTGTGDQHPKE